MADRPAAGTPKGRPEEIHPQLTWDDIKSWAATQGVPGDAKMYVRHGSILAPHQRVRDVDYFEADDDGPAHFIISDVWG